MDEFLNTHPGYIAATDAAARFSLTNDHIASLARKKKIDGQLVGGRVWYINEESLTSYLKEVKLLKEKRRSALSQQLRQNHAEHFAKTVITPVTSSDVVPTPSPIQPRRSTSSRVAMAAFIFVLSAGFANAAHMVAGQYIQATYALRDAQSEMFSEMFAAEVALGQLPGEAVAPLANLGAHEVAAAAYIHDTVAPDPRGMVSSVFVALPMPDFEPPQLTLQDRSADLTAALAVPYAQLIDASDAPQTMPAQHEFSLKEFNDSLSQADAALFAPYPAIWNGALHAADAFIADAYATRDAAAAVFMAPANVFVPSVYALGDGQTHAWNNIGVAIDTVLSLADRQVTQSAGEFQVSTAHSSGQVANLWSLVGVWFERSFKLVSTSSP